jgi:hypothetical protein
MVRLAKMYLYGQGCVRSVSQAQEWLRRARRVRRGLGERGGEQCAAWGGALRPGRRVGAGARALRNGRDEPHVSRGRPRRRKHASAAERSAQERKKDLRPLPGVC